MVAGDPNPHRPLTDFCIDQTEVSAAAYGQCVAAGVCEPPVTGDLYNWGDADRESHPINGVTIEQAQGYCTWRKARLPTSREWAWAAGGGTAETTYPWGNEEGDLRDLCVDREPQAGTCPVDASNRDVTSDGIKHLAGNVAEWTTDPDGTNAYWQGEGWFSPYAGRARSARPAPKTQAPNVGFRCVAEPD